MAIIHPSKWVRPIEVEDFSNFTATPLIIEPGKSHLYEMKDSLSNTGYHLRAKVKMTFAGIRTKNRAIYLPDEHFKSAQKFLTPYPKPILPHHDEDRDPIGRVIDVRYVDTVNEAMMIDSRVAKIASTFKDAKAKVENRLSTVPAMLSLSSNDSYKGMGYILGLWDVTDPDAIQKILDGRYLTVSTSMVPQGAYCSQCAREGDLTDWAKQDCDHGRGDIIDGVECVAVPYNYEWAHVSPVNEPAAPLSQIIEAGEGLSFADARTEYSIPYEIFSDVYFGKEGTEQDSFCIKDGKAAKLPSKLELSSIKTPTSKTPTVIGKQDSNQTLILEGKVMKVTDLTKDTAQNYEAIVKHLPEGAVRLTGALLTDLEDSVFIGPNRTFPAKDLVHAEAIKALLGTIDDSEAKATLVEAVDAVIVKLTPVTEVQATEVIADEVVADATVNTETDTVTVTKEFLDALNVQVALLDDVTLDRDLLKKKVANLQSEIDSLNATYTAVLKLHKETLAESLVDAQEARGFKIEDRAETLKKFIGRSVDSLKDAIADLKSQPLTGADRKVNGEAAPNPLATGGISADDAVKYKGIIDKYFDLYYQDGSAGPIKATNFLNDAKRNRLIPATLQP